MAALIGLEKLAFFTHISHYARAREARRSAQPGGGNFFFRLFA